MLFNVFQLIVGIILLAFGSDRLIDACSILAKKLNVSPIVIGVVIVGFGASIPELVIASLATAQGNLGIAVGNAIGTNITNIALVVGLTALIMPLTVHTAVIKREFPIVFAVLFGVFVLFYSGVITRVEGILMCFAMLLIIYGLYLINRKQTVEEPVTKKMSTKIMIFWLIVGLVLLVASADIVVYGAIGIAKKLGVSEIVIAITVVAFGTSLPELVASVVSVLKKEPDIAIGNVIGANLFNLLVVLGVPATIHPLPIEKIVLYRDYSVMLGLTIALFLMCLSKGVIKRWYGAGLLLVYIVYITALVV